MTSLLLFLDIDGVLNPAGSHPNGPHLEPACTAALREFLTGFDTAIVMSTSWRACYSAEAFAGFFSEHGIASPVIGLTPCRATQGLAPRPTSRGEEIEAWLTANPPPPDTAILILEDHQDLHPLRDYAYYTNPATGLTQRDLPGLQKLISPQLPISQSRLT